MLANWFFVRAVVVISPTYILYDRKELRKIFYVMRNDDSQATIIMKLYADDVTENDDDYECEGPPAYQMRMNRFAELGNSCKFHAR